VPTVGQLYDKVARALAFPEPDQRHDQASQWVMGADDPDSVLLSERAFLRSVSRSLRASGGSALPIKRDFSPSRVMWSST